MENNDRRNRYRKPPKLEQHLQYFEKLLGPIEEKEISKIEFCDEPILYIMGCGRSGTTLIYQYLSQSGIFTYPSNLVSRFYYAPYIGAKIQAMLIDDDFCDEIVNQNKSSMYDSKLGKTKGAKSPHEFWYFWRRFFSFKDTQKLSIEALKSVNTSQFINELRAMQSVQKLPLILKGMILNWHIPFLSKLYNKTYFVYVKRSVQANAESLVRARLNFYGDFNKWYSFKPPGYEKVINLEPHCQTLWQVLETNTAIEKGLKRVAEQRVVKVNYEEFCKSPTLFFNRLSDRLDKKIKLNKLSKILPESFINRNTNELCSTDLNRAISSISQFLS